MNFLFCLTALLGGAIAGFSSGLLGVGGGWLIVPFLYLLFSLSITEAIGTSLFIIFFTSVSGTFAHLRKGNIYFPIILPLVISGMIGVRFGALTALSLPEIYLKVLFFLLLIFSGFKMFFQKEEGNFEEIPSHFNFYLLTLSGLICGYLSGLLGVGGAFILMPLLHLFFKFPMRICIGSSLLVILFNGFVGGISYLLAGKVNIPLLFLLSLSSIIFAPLGAETVSHISQERLRRIFAILLFLIAFSLFFKSQ